MNLQQLKVLVLIAEHKKVTAAAESMRLTHPTVGFHMRKLEETIGAPLYDRRHNRILLTHAGALLLPYARQIVSVAEEAAAVLAKALQNEENKLAIGCTPTLGKKLIPRLLRKLRQELPHVHVDIKIEKPDAVARLLAGYEIDIGILSEYHVAKYDFARIPFSDGNLGIALYSSHPLAHIDPIHPLQLEQERWLVREQGTVSRSVLDAWVTRHRLELRDVSEFGSTDTIKEAVLSGLGISVIAYSTIEEEVKAGKLVFHRFDFVQARKTMFLYAKSNKPSPLMKKVIHLLSRADWREDANGSRG